MEQAFSRASKFFASFHSHLRRPNIICGGQLESVSTSHRFADIFSRSLGPCEATWAKFLQSNSFLAIVKSVNGTRKYHRIINRSAVWTNGFNRDKQQRNYFNLFVHLRDLCSIHSHVEHTHTHRLTIRRFIFLFRCRSRCCCSVSFYSFFFFISYIRLFFVFSNTIKEANEAEKTNEKKKKKKNAPCASTLNWSSGCC